MWHIVSRAGHLWLGFQFGASHYLQFRSTGFFFGLPPYCSVFVILCIGSFLMTFSRVVIRASGMVFFLLFRLCVFCCICSTIFGSSQSFSFSNLFCKFLSVIDVINFDINTLVLKSGKLHSFSISINSSQWFSSVSVSVCFPQKNCLVSCIFFFSTGTICCIIWLTFLFWYYPDRFGNHIVLFNVLLRISMPKRSLVVSLVL